MLKIKLKNLIAKIATHEFGKFVQYVSNQELLLMLSLNLEKISSFDELAKNCACFFLGKMPNEFLQHGEIYFFITLGK